MPVKTVARTKAGKLNLDEAVAYMIESIAEMSQRIADSQEETDAKMAKSKAESEAKMAKSKEETDEKIANAIDRLTKQVEKIAHEAAGIGPLGNKFGTIIELIVTPGIRKEINSHGHNFRYSAANKVFRCQKRDIAEADLFLYNGVEAMAVEIKAGLTMDDVKKHIKQLKTLRKYEVETNLKGKKLYGGVVGLTIEKNAREHALRNGLYILEILEQEQKLKTEKPTKCRVW